MPGDFNQDRLNETYKSLITISLEGFKYLALINGGAVVALLAYLGNLTKDGKAVPDLRWPMLCFLIGLSACGIAMLFAYLTQLKLLNELLKPGTFSVRHSFTLWVAIAAYVVSLAGFCVGAWWAVGSFK